MKNKATLALLALVIAASGCVSNTTQEHRNTHSDVVQFLEDDEDNKEIIGVIGGETQRENMAIRVAQWKDYHDYTPKYYCFEQDDTKYCELKEQYRTGGY